jgi:CheY-like chemotaxis protein
MEITVPPESTAPRCRILVVEDDANTRLAMQRLLENMGHAVEAAGSLSAANECAVASRFDLLIADVTLPDGDGLELLGRMRQTQPHIVGIVLTGHATSEALQRTRDAGFARHVTKPVLGTNLIEVIEEVMSSGSTV